MATPMSQQEWQRLNSESVMKKLTRAELRLIDFMVHEWRGGGFGVTAGLASASPSGAHKQKLPGGYWWFERKEDAVKYVLSLVEKP